MNIPTVVLYVSFDFELDIYRNLWVFHLYLNGRLSHLFNLIILSTAAVAAA